MSSLGWQAGSWETSTSEGGTRKTAERRCRLLHSNLLTLIYYSSHDLRGIVDSIISFQFYILSLEKARLQAEAKAAEEAHRKAEEEAAAEAKRKRELEREAARQALLKVNCTDPAIYCPLPNVDLLVLFRVSLGFMFGRKKLISTKVKVTLMH